MTQPDFFEDLEGFEKESSKQPVALKEAPDFFEGLDEVEASPDFFSSFEEPSFIEKVGTFFKDKFTPKPFGNENVYDIYRPEDITPEEMQKMTGQELLEYGRELSRFRELQQSKGFTKGAISGATLGVSEYIPGLEPEEEDLMRGVGEAAGSYLPISLMYKFIGGPLVHFAAKSPYARQGLMSLARMTGFGLTGATHKATKDIIQGEVPTTKELAKEGAIWLGIDAALQAAGVGIAFSQAVKNISKTENIPAKEVLGKLWDATKGFIKTKFGRPVKAELLPEDAEILLEQAKKAEKEGLSSVIEEPIELKPEKPFEGKLSDQQLEINLADAKKELAELEQAQGKGATKEKSEIIQRINALELEKHNRTKEAPEKSTGIKEAFAEAGKGITEGFYNGIFNALKEDKSTFAGVKDPLIQRAKPYFDKGLIKTPEDLKIFANKGPEALVPKEEAKTTKVEGVNTRADFPTKKEAQEYLEHLQKSLAKAPEAHKAGLKRDIKNIESLISEFEKEEGSVPPAPVEAKPAVKPKSKIIDERPIMKEIMDLKAALKGEKSRSKKESIKNDIRQKARELGDIRRKNEAYQKELTKGFGKPDVTTKGLKSQKQFILEKVDEALANPPDTNFIEIDVPGDGIFRINNEKRILENFREKVAKKWPVKGVREHSSEVKALSSRIVPKKPTQVPPKQTRPRRPVMGKKQAVARSKILKLFRTAFTDPIRLGKFRQRALGIHKLWPKVTRLLKDNDIETAAHEIGHNLHTTLYGGDAKTPTEQFANINRALAPYLGELKPLAHYEPWGMEGFAEFTRLFVTNHEVAQELAPKFYDKFENDLRAQYPEMLNALLEAREYYEAYLHGTPQSRIRAQTSYGSDKGKLANIIEAAKKYLHPDKLKTEFLDDIFPAKRLVAEAFGIPLNEVENLKDERNLYRALRVLKGAVGKGDVFVLHETFNAKTLDKINGSLRDILKKLPNEEAYREFNDYLIARRAIEKTAQGIETGINAGDAVAVEADLRPKYGKLAKELDKYNDALLTYAQDSGLISQSQYEMIKKNNVLYVPFQRVMEPEKGGMAAGGGRLQAGKPIKRMKGSSRDIIAPIESIIKNTYSIIINAEKNLAGQVLAKLARTKKDIGAYVEHVPAPIKLKGSVQGEQVARELAKRFEQEGLADLIEYDSKGKPVLREDIADAIPEVFLRFGTGQYPAGENIVTVYVKGKPTYYEVSPDIFEMWTKGIAPYTAGIITKILRIPARTLRAGAILNPKFMLKNIVRDTWGSWLFTKYGKSIKDPAGLFIDTLYSPLAMLATSAGKGALYVEWLKSGGGMSTMQSLDREAIIKKLEEVRHGLKPYQVIKWLRLVAEISEETNRLSEFGKALEVEGKTRLGREIAAFAARDLSIDFAKIGLQTKSLNQIIPFFNATVQGGDKLIRALANPDDRKNFIPRVIGFIVIPSLILAWLNKDDENVKELQEQEKDFNFITKVGDSYIKIPVPFETGVIAHGLTQRMFNHFVKEDPEAFEGFIGSVSDAMLPNFIPTIGNPFIETWANKNFFTGGRIIPAGKEGLVSKYQYKNYTSLSARLLGRAMAYMMGNPETRSKAASPAVLEHFVVSWTGGLGRLMIRISDASLEAAGYGDKIPRPDEAITERLGLDAFTTRYPRANTRSIEKFYDLYADATARRKSFKHAEKMELEPEEEIAEAEKRFEKIYDYRTLQMTYKAMQNCQREINAIWNDPGMDPAFKKEMIDDLYLEMIKAAQQAIEDIRKNRLDQED